MAISHRDGAAGGAWRGARHPLSHNAGSHNADGDACKRFAETPEADLDRLLAARPKGMCFAARAVCPARAPRGSDQFIRIAWRLAFEGSAGSAGVPVTATGRLLAGPGGGCSRGGTPSRQGAAVMR